MTPKASYLMAGAIGLTLGTGIFAAFPVGTSQAQHGYNAKLTPGVIDPTVTTHILCTTSTRTRRNVSYATKVEVYREYGIKSHAPGQYEVDHLIPLELGGSNDIRNLWPEPAPGFHAKDALENSLHDKVCRDTITLKQAQHDVANGVK